MTRSPTPDEIRAAVAQALAGHASLEVLVCRLVKGRDPHPDDPAWPPEQRRVWVRAVDLYMEARRLPFMRAEPNRLDPSQGGRRSEAPAPSVAQVWVAVERLTEDRPWWEINHGWAQIAAVLGMNKRRARYWFSDVQGWRFTGHTAHREITVAPCVACGEPTPREHIQERRCPACQSPMGDTPARLTEPRQ